MADDDAAICQFDPALARPRRIVIARQKNRIGRLLGTEPLKLIEHFARTLAKWRSEFLPGMFTRLVTGEITPLQVLVRYPEPEKPL